MPAIWNSANYICKHIALYQQCSKQTKPVLSFNMLCKSFQIYITLNTNTPLICFHPTHHIGRQTGTFNWRLLNSLHVFEFCGRQIPKGWEYEKSSALALKIPLTLIISQMLATKNPIFQTLSWPITSLLQGALLFINIFLYSVISSQCLPTFP